MNVYLDTLVIVNIYISWTLISLTARLGHFICTPKRKALASVLGGFSSLLILIPNESKKASAAILLLKLLSFIAIPTAAFLKKGISKKRLALSFMLYIFLNTAFGGIVYLAGTVLGSGVIYINNCSYYFDISLECLIFLTAAIYAAVCLASWIFERTGGKNGAYRVGFTVGNDSYCIEGISDTGNTVTDLFSGKSVVICTGFGHSPPAGNIRAVPYSTVNGEGLLYAFSPDGLYIEDASGEKKEVSALVAFTDGTSKRAVFNPKILT